jgi:hypothetical protein
MITCDENGRFDGALLFDRYNEYRGPQGIVAMAHRGNKLGLVRNLGTYYKAEFLEKRTSQATRSLIWDDMRSQVICQSESEGKVLIEEFVQDNA